MAVRDFTGTDRVINRRYEGKPGHRVVEYDEEDGSKSVGYELPDGTLTGSTPGVFVSPARLAALAAQKAPVLAAEAQIATFKQSLLTLRTVIANNSGTVAQQQAAQRAALVKLINVALGTLSD